MLCADTGGGGGRAHSLLEETWNPGLIPVSAAPCVRLADWLSRSVFHLFMVFFKATEMFYHMRVVRKCCLFNSRWNFRRLLNNNQIKSIPGGSFEDLENLKYL